ncbi:PREDICTED: carbon catabolite repressor protein 4 homolog 5 isoform X4 [Nelumbo nucifera]|uniref:Carbon catabolite repressor protein 4 homolog 5 isoform X4 n=1 Tax=Nelumbo nucifera TaxID=4432 RepID=A0A1U7ZJY7_NELNU|nr:PREDICTED: carbon catabolite repressor protein 4 homolog 5 isoform X4 [Nelumbo nucifera]
MRSSASSFQCLAAAAADASMSSSRASSGGRYPWRRGFSDRPSGGRDTFVSGDSHFRTVRETNYGFRQGQRGSFRDPGGFQPQNFRPRPPFRQPLPYGHHPPVRQQRPKPLDYRNWEYALSQPPGQCERFIVLSYNILADYLATNHRRELYFHIPRYMLDWEWRKKRMVFELRLWSPDIMCLQEVDRFHDLEEELKLQGYEGIWKMRTGTAVDGCAIFWRTSRFKLLYEEFIEFNKLGLRDNVAQICVLESRSQNAAENESEASCSSSKLVNQVVICNTHVLYNPKRGEVKLGQVRVLLDRAHAVSRSWNNAPVVLCGDFNCTPKSPLYNYILEQKLDLSGLARDQISGQSSAEIHAPKPPDRNLVNGLYRGKSSSDSIGASEMVDEMGFGIKQSDNLTDVHDQNKSSNDVEHLLSRGNFSQPQHVIGVLDMSNKPCSNEQYEDANNPISDVTTKITELDIVDGRKEEIGSTASLASDCSKENPSNYQMEDKETKMQTPYQSAHLGNMSETSFGIEFNGISVDPKVVDMVKDACVCETESSAHSSKVDNEKDSFTFDFICGDKLKGPDLAEADQSLEECVIITKESKSYLLSGEVQDGFLPHKESVLAEMEKYTYDPYLWTPKEIETATGNAECTLLEHPLKLRSTYAEVEDYSGTRDSSREPQVTSYNRRFLGTVDYIWHSEGLQTVKVLDTIPKHIMQFTPGFPTHKWGSDHIALACQLAFVRDAAQS